MQLADVVRATPAPAARRWLGAPLGLAVVLVLAAVDLSAGADRVLIALLVVGPATAAVAGSARGVALVGAVTVVVVLGLAGTDDLWSTGRLAIVVAAVVMVTVITALSAFWRERLAAETERMASIVRSSADVVVGKRLDGTITSWNNAATELYGWAADEVIGRHISIIVPEDRRAELEQIHRRVAEGQRVEAFLTKRVARDGRLLDMSLSASPIWSTSGHVVGVSAVARDVTVQLRMTEAVRESEARKAAILQSALDAIITIDDAGRVIEVNPATTTTFGWTAEEMVGQELAELLIPEASRDAHRAGLADYGRTGSSPVLCRRLELTAVRKDGTSVPVEVTITPVPLADRTVFTGYLRDLSARREAETEAARLDDRLRQTDRLDALGQLAGGVAHDFNNLLAVILNYSSLARDDLPAGQARDDVDSISAAAQRAVELTRQLLTFSTGAGATGGMADPNAVVERVAGILRRTLPATIDVLTRPVAEPWPVRCDDARLDQVLMNLALNSRDAMPDGGTLTIETSNVQLDELSVTSRLTLQPGRYLRLTVTDTGSGMSRDVLNRAFDPFFTTKPAGQGTGLGLATVYGIARQIGGEVTIYSELDRGTSVRLFLPVADDLVAAPVPGPAAVRDAMPELAGRSILLVEDEELLRKALERTLTGAGFAVTSVATAEAALASAGDDAPDLLLTDITLPGMTGPALALRLRDKISGLRVLLMSGYAAQQLPAELAGTVQLLDKPFPVEVLLGAVRDALGSPEPPAPPELA